LSDHALARRLRQQPDGVEVDRQHAPPVLQGQVGAVLAMDGPGIVDQNIQPAERVRGKAHDLLGGGLIHACEIGLYSRALAPQGLDPREGLFGLMGAIGQRHIGPGGGKAEGYALADAGCPAGDQGLAARQIKRIAHDQYRFAMGSSSAGNSDMTSQPVGVTTTSSSIRAAEYPSAAGQ
jgi:hypothetical protein